MEWGDCTRESRFGFCTKKTVKSNSYITTHNAIEGRKECGVTLKKTGRSGFRTREVLILYRLRAYYTDVRLSRTHTSVMCVTVSKTDISFPTQRVRKHVSVGLFGCVCRVYTEVHMSLCPVLFISFFMRHSKKFLGSEWVTTHCECNGVKNVKHTWRKMSPMTQWRFMSHVHICSWVCPQESQRDRRSKSLVWSRVHPTVLLQVDTHRNIYRTWSYVQHKCQWARSWL